MPQSIRIITRVDASDYRVEVVLKSVLHAPILEGAQGKNRNHFLKALDILDHFRLQGHNLYLNCSRSTVDNSIIDD